MTCHALLRTPLEDRLLDDLYLPPLADDVEWRDEEHRPVPCAQKPPLKAHDDAGVLAIPLETPAAARRDAPVTALGRLRSLLRFFSAEHPFRVALPLARIAPAFALSPLRTPGRFFGLRAGFQTPRGPAKDGGRRGSGVRRPSILSTLSEAVQFAAFLLAVSSWGLLFLLLGAEVSR